MRVGSYGGRELIKANDTYYYLVGRHIEDEIPFQPVHDGRGRVRVTLGKYENDIDALEALADRVDREESDI